MSTDTAAKVFVETYNANESARVGYPYESPHLRADDESLLAALRAALNGPPDETPSIGDVFATNF